MRENNWRQKVLNTQGILLLRGAEKWAGRGICGSKRSL